MIPKVSVIMPTYKRAGAILERAIKSVLNQTYKNIELIVVDDNIENSSFRKETELSIQEYANDNRVVYIKNKVNLGGALARNEGIWRCTGDYITFLDDDDIYLPEKIETQLNFMHKNGYEMTFTDLKIHNNQDKLIDYRQYNAIKDFSKSCLMKFHIMRHITGTPTFMYKKDSLIKIGGFVDHKVSQEFYLMLNTIDNNLKIGYLPMAYVIAYLHDGEKISKGANKLNGENDLFRFKTKYFTEFTPRERMFIRFRYHAVMAVAGIRSKLFITFIKHAILAVFSSPIDAVIEPTNHLKRVFQDKGIGSSM